MLLNQLFRNSCWSKVTMAFPEKISAGMLMFTVLLLKNSS
jgi:hypothetical protein